MFDTLLLVKGPLYAQQALDLSLTFRPLHHMLSDPPDPLCLLNLMTSVRTLQNYVVNHTPVYLEDVHALCQATDSDSGDFRRRIGSPEDIRRLRDGLPPTE